MRIHTPSEIVDATNRASRSCSSAVGMMAFLSVSMLAIDVGMLMTARNQAQNSADAGALAGATALVFDDWDDRTRDRTGGDERARRLRQANQVMSGARRRSTPADVEFLNDPPASRTASR